MSIVPVMGPVGGQDSYTSTRPPRFGDPTKEDYPSYRRDVELWLKLTEVTPAKRGVALVGCLSGEPKEFVKTMPDELLFADESGTNVLAHLDRAYQNSSEMILNSRVSAFLDYQRLPSMTISTYIAGFYARLDSLAQLQMPDELKGHLLLKQANLEPSEKIMVIASARGSYKVKDVVDSMRQLYGERVDVPTAGSSFATVESKKFCNYCKKRNHVEADCWKKRKACTSDDVKDDCKVPDNSRRGTYATFLSTPQDDIERSALIDSGAVHTIVGLSTLDKIMKSYGISRIEKCQPLSLVHRFGTNGTPMEPEFGAIIPWAALDTGGAEHEFNLRADVLEGDHPLLIGCPTLINMKASLDFNDLKLSATINDKRCVLPLHRGGNHIYMGHAPRTLVQGADDTLYQHQFSSGHYDPPSAGTAQFFQQPGHC
jgi:hypothetical protein